jgi:hypothetical protein
VGATLSTLTNGTTEYNPLNGYQYVLTNGIAANAPDAIWIKGDQFCPAMTNASKVYFQSPEFLTRQAELQPFYDKFTPLLASIFPQDQIGFHSAYGIFDYLNVGYIHNKTINSNFTSDDLFQLRTHRTCSSVQFIIPSHIHRWENSLRSSFDGAQFHCLRNEQEPQNHLLRSIVQCLPGLLGDLGASRSKS